MEVEYWVRINPRFEIRNSKPSLSLPNTSVLQYSITPIDPLTANSRQE